MPAGWCRRRTRRRLRPVAARWAATALVSRWRRRRPRCGDAGRIPGQNRPQTRVLLAETAVRTDERSCGRRPCATWSPPDRVCAEEPVLGGCGDRFQFFDGLHARDVGPRARRPLRRADRAIFRSLSSRARAWRATPLRAGLSRRARTHSRLRSSRAAPAKTKNRQSSVSQKFGAQVAASRHERPCWALRGALMNGAPRALRWSPGPGQTPSGGGGARPTRGTLSQAFGRRGVAGDRCPATPTVATR